MPLPSPSSQARASDLRQTLELVYRSQRFPCHDGDVIGREGTVAAEALGEAKTMSRQHLLISWRDHAAGSAPSGWFVKLAPNARNNTLLDGRSMQRDLPHALNVGEHYFNIIGFEFVLHVTDFTADLTNDGTARLAAGQPVPGLEQLRQQFGADGLFHLVADHTRDLIAIIDDHGRRVWNNAAYFSCLGYRPEDIRQSYSMAEIHPDDLPLVKQTFEDSMRTGTGSRIEYRMRHHDQRWIYLESQASVVEVAGAAGHYLVLVARDITARKDAEQKALLRARHLVERTATLARFTQSHELQEGNLESCFAQVVEAAAKHFECERASVWLFSPGGETLVCQDLFEPLTLQHSRDATWPVSACGQFLAALRVNRCLAIDSAFTDERLAELRPIYLFSHRVSSFLAARICLGSEVLGVLVLERTDVIEHWSLGGSELRRLPGGRAAGGAPGAQAGRGVFGPAKKPAPARRRTDRGQRLRPRAAARPVVGRGGERMAFLAVHLAGGRRVRPPVARRPPSGDLFARRGGPRHRRVAAGHFRAESVARAGPAERRFPRSRRGARGVERHLRHGEAGGHVFHDVVRGLRPGETRGSPTPPPAIPRRCCWPRKPAPRHLRTPCSAPGG